MNLDFQKILSLEGCHGWTIKIIHSGGGLCVHDTYEIWLDESHKDSLPWFLHEVAHIKFKNHTSNWADHYTALLDKYSGKNKANKRAASIARSSIEAVPIALAAGRAEALKEAVKAIKKEWFKIDIEGPMKKTLEEGFRLGIRAAVDAVKALAKGEGG